MSVFPTFEESAECVERSDGPGVPWIHLKPRSVADVARCLGELAATGIAVFQRTPAPLPPGSSVKSVAFIDLSNVSAVVDHQRPDQVVTVETGIELAQLDLRLAESGQWWPVSIPKGGATVADIIGSGDGGCHEHGFGGPRDLVLGMDVALSSGQMIKCGGRVVKNVTGYDLQKLFIGSSGWLGLPVRANLRLYARPESVRTVLALFDDAATALTAAGKLAGSGLPLSVLELTDQRSLGEAATVDSPGNGFPGIVSEEDGRPAMLAQVVGHRAMTGEVVESVARLVRPHCRAWHEIDPEAGALLVSALSAGMAGRSGGLTLTASLRFADALFREPWAAPGELRWQMRPGRGRLQFRGVSDQPQALSVLRRLASDTGESVTVGLRDQQGFAYRVYRLAQEDSARMALNDALKRRFDPSLCLNPLVSL